MSRNHTLLTIPFLMLLLTAGSIRGQTIISGKRIFITTDAIRGMGQQYCSGRYHQTSDSLLFSGKVRYPWKPDVFSIGKAENINCECNTPLFTPPFLFTHFGRNIAISHVARSSGTDAPSVPALFSRPPLYTHLGKTGCFINKAGYTCLVTFSPPAIS